MIEFAKLLLALRYGRVPFNLEHVKQNCSSCAVDNESRLFSSQRRRSMGLCFCALSEHSLDSPRQSDQESTLSAHCANTKRLEEQ